MNKKRQKDIHFIVYDDGKIPTSLKLNKKLVQTFFFVTPLIVFAVIFYSLMTKNKIQKQLKLVQNQKPALITKLEEQKNELQAKIFNLNKQIQILEEKVAKGPDQNSNFNSLYLFSAPLAMKDLTEQDKVSIENTSFSTKGNQIEFKFDLVNSSNEKYVNGYIHVLQVSDSEIQHHPGHKIKAKKAQYLYHKGETFYVSRFRPVITLFQKPTTSLNVLYRIYIYSSTGDLLGYKVTDIFQVN